MKMKGKPANSGKLAKPGKPGKLANPGKSM